MLPLKGPHQSEYRPLPSEEKFAYQCQVFPDANSTAGSSVLVQSCQYIYSKLNSMANQGLPLPPGRQNPPYPGSNQSSGTAVARRTPSGRYIFLSRDESELSEMMSSEMMSGELTTPNYNVYLPPTPDNQPMNQVVQQQLVPSTLFTGGFNNMTEGRVLEKVGNSAAGQLMNIFSCEMRACDGKAMRNESGEFIYPCECQFKLCNECYLEKFNSDGKCPGCKEPLKPLDMDGSKVLPMVSPKAQPKTDRRLSIMKSMKPSNTIVKREPPIPEFDHNGWLFESKGTYGYGNAVWPKDDAFVNGDGDSKPPIFSDRLKKPMSRKIKVPAKTLSPYRFLAVARFVILGLFLHWRVKHPNRDAMWLWGMSVVCEIWFAFSWLLDQLPKLCPVNRSTDLLALKERFETPGPNNPKGISDLPGIDLFVSTADPEKEPPLVTANTILSILAAEYPVEKMACYVSDDGGALLTFEALAEAASFARTWVPFCRKHDIEPRNPESYFTQKGDPTKNKLRTDFVRDRRRVKREYDEFKVRINCLPDAIRRRSDAYNANEEIKAHRAQMESGVDMAAPISVVKATWMSDATHWPGTWVTPAKDHSRGDHAGVIQVMLPPANYELVTGGPTDQGENLIDTTDIDIRLPMLVYVSREKRVGYDHNKKAGAMNALVRTSAIMSNGAFILNLDCDHYIYNTLALREAMCFMLDRNGGGVCYVQFPQRFEGIDASDRYANHNTVFFDSNMRALDGLQGPVYVGTGCCFRRVALYGFDPPKVKSRNCFGEKKEKKNSGKAKREAELNAMNNNENDIIGIPEDEELEATLVPKRYGNSIAFLESIPVAEYQGRPLADIEGTKFGRPSGALIAPRQPLDAGTVAEAINVISCHFEDKTEWGDRVGWIYGSVTEDVVTGFRMHNRGWRSIYCVTKRDAFRGTAPINLTDRLHQVLRWATGSVEIFFSRNNALLGSCRLKFLQRIAYLNVGIYPFTSIFLLVYCFLPALSLFTNQFIVNKLDITYLIYLFLITIMLCLLAVLEIRWSHITLEEWWRNEQFWVIGGTSAHLAAVFQGLLKVIAGVDISFTLTSKGADEDDEFADLYLVKWSSLMIPPLTLIMTNLIAICVSVARTIYSSSPQWSKLLGGVFFSFWVLVHLYPFAKGLMGRRGKMPTIIFVWAGLLAIIISLLWVSNSSGQGSTFTFP